MITSLTIVCLLAITGAFLWMSIQHIPEGVVYTLQRRHGGPLQLLTAGTHMIVPLRDHIAHKISLTGRTLQLDTMLDEIRVRGAVYWQVLDPERADATIDQADVWIRQHTLDGLRANRDDDDAMRNGRLKNRLNHALRPQGMLVTRLDVHTAT